MRVELTNLPAADQMFPVKGVKNDSRVLVRATRRMGLPFTDKGKAERLVKMVKLGVALWTAWSWGAC